MEAEAVLMLVAFIFFVLAAIPITINNVTINFMAIGLAFMSAAFLVWMSALPS